MKIKEYKALLSKQNVLAQTSELYGKGNGFQRHFKIAVTRNFGGKSP
jgi:hypothetical protein